MLSHLALAGLLVTGTHGYYLPGVAPHDYKNGAPVDVLVNSVSAVDSLIPYDFYYPQFHFCLPKEGISSQKESLGAILFGDRLFNSAFEIKAKENKTCATLCPSTIPPSDAAFINDRIREEYSMNWLVDGLPAAQEMEDREGKRFYQAGFALGKHDSSKPEAIPFMNNHYEVIIYYHEKDTARVRVVGVIVHPKSVPTAEQEANCAFTDINVPKFSLATDKETKVTYTYSVKWIPSPVAWGTRWDNYLHVFDSQIHWFSIVNSIVIVVILSSMVFMILVRALHKDIARYNAAGDEDGVQEEFGWKLVHADAFRPPSHRLLLSVLVGNGIHILCMCGVTLAFAVLGFLSPSSRGALGTMIVVGYVFFASVSGYVSARLYKSLQGEHWKKNVVATALLVPGLCFVLLLSLNFFLVHYQSSAAVPFGTLLALVTMWFLISVPLCVVGAYAGFKHPAFEPPCKTNQIPRQIPDQPWYLNKWVSALIGGILPFGAIFIELYFILSSFWSNRVYYMFGFLMVVFVILVITCSLVSVILCYFFLCAEDYNWHWRSFMISGASGFYVFLYSVVFFSRKLHLVNMTSSVLFFGWSLVFSGLFTIFTGAIGFIATFIFVRLIFGSIKVD